jgi:perosamine synthetase
MDRLLAIGMRYGIPVIEDAAEAIGSIYHGRRAGSMGKFGAFSFHGTKTITTGEGGIFVTNDEELYENVLMLSNHGRSRQQTKQFWPDAVGFKFKMSNIQAAIGCGQMERIEELISRKREILFAYKNELLGLEHISMNPEPEGTVNGAWMPTIVFNRDLEINQKEIIEAFRKENIDARVFFWPLSSLNIFEFYPNNLNARNIADRSVNLPSYHDMSNGEIFCITEVVRSLAKQ